MKLRLWYSLAECEGQKMALVTEGDGRPSTALNAEAGRRHNSQEHDPVSEWNGNTCSSASRLACWSSCAGMTAQL